MLPCKQGAALTPLNLLAAAPGLLARASPLKANPVAESFGALLYHRVPKCWTHRTKINNFCDGSVREKAWRSRKPVAQAT